MPPETDETFPDKEAPSVPDAPLAIRELTLAVQAMHKDFRRFDANLELLTQEMRGFKQSVYEMLADHNKRLSEVEAIVKAHLEPKKSKKKGRK